MGISKFLFNIDWTSLFEAPVEFKILFNLFVDVPFSAKVFREFTFIVLEKMLVALVSKNLQVDSVEHFYQAKYSFTADEALYQELLMESYHFWIQQPYSHHP